MPRNHHPDLPNEMIHPPKDFASANGGDVMRKNLNDELEWSNQYWKNPVLDLADINATPPTETDGARYIVIEVASTVADAAWDGATVDQIVEFSGTTGVWAAKTPIEGDIVHDNDSNNLYKYTGTEWMVIVSAGGGDFSDGGEAGGADRTLGNTDNYDLGFLTNGSTRLHIQNDGKVGIGTITPTALMHIVDDTTGTAPQLIVDSSGNGDSKVRWELSGTSTGVQFDLSIDYSTNKFRLDDNNVGQWFECDTDSGEMTFINPMNIQDTLTISGDVVISLTDMLRIPARTNVTAVNAIGEMVLDTDGDGSTITTGVLTMHDGTQNIYGVGTTNYPSTDNDVPAYNSSTNSVTWQAQSGGGSVNLPSGYIYDMKLSYVSATTIQIATGCCRDGADGYDIELTGTQNVALTTSGANGLDTGSEASSTLYYVWVIEKSGDGTTGGLLSLSDSAPTMPSGYDKKRLIGAMYNDSSSDVMPFQARGKGNTRYMFLDDTVTPLILLNGGSATTFTNVDVSALVPSISQNIFVRCSFQRTAFGNIDDAFYVRPDGSSAGTPPSRVGGMFDDTDPAAFTRVLLPIELSSSQIFEYQVDDVDNDLSLFLIYYQFEL